MFAFKSRVIIVVISVLTLTLFGPVFPSSATSDVPISIFDITGVTPPVANVTPVEVITPNDQFTGTVSWEDKDGPLVGNFKSSTIYKATITLVPEPGFSFQELSENFFTIAGATNVRFFSDAGIITAYFNPIFGEAIDYLDRTFATNGTFDLLDIFGMSPITQNNTAVSALQVDRMAVDSEERIVVFGSFYSDSADRVAIGSGYRNSLAIAAQPNNESATSAAVASLNYRGGNQSDWYLPSKEEMSLLFSESLTVGFIDEERAYWSSTEDGNRDAWVYIFNSSVPGEGISSKDIANAVRPIRSGTLTSPIVGDTGPGGGKIFYETTTPFTCGPTSSITCNYLEAAPSNWTGDDREPLISWASGLENQTTQVSIDHHILFRLNADGSHDNTFGNPGTTLRKNDADSPKRYSLVATTGYSYTERIDLEIDFIDRPIVMLSGSAPGSNSGNYHNFIARFKADGTIDENFGNNGAIGDLNTQNGFRESLFADFTLDLNNNIVAISHSNIAFWEATIQRFSTDGLPDLVFGLDESGTTLVTLGYPEIASSSPSKNLRIVADGSGGYILLFTAYFCFTDNEGEQCPEDYIFSQLIRFHQGGVIDNDFNLFTGFNEGPPNVIPYFAFTDLIPEGSSGLVLSGTSIGPSNTNINAGIILRLKMNGELDLDFAGDGIEIGLNPLFSEGCVNTAFNMNLHLNRSYDSALYGAEICSTEGDGPPVLRVKSFTSLGEFLGGANLSDVSSTEYIPSINQINATSEGNLLVLSGSEPYAGLWGLQSQMFGSGSPWNEVKISRYQLVDSPELAPAPVSISSPAPVLTPYLKTLTAPSMRNKDEKLTCSAGTYNAGYTLSGVNQGSATSLAIPSSFTYKLFFDGRVQESLTVISESATASWKISLAPVGALITCSVAASVNGATNLDRSTDNNVGVAAAMSAKESAISLAQIAYPESLTANSKTYQRALVDNRAKWRSDTEKNRRDYRAKLEKLKSAPSTTTTSASVSRAFKSFSAARKKILADYTAGIPAALVAKELADRNALISREAAIAKAKASYGSFIESLGYGVLIL